MESLDEQNILTLETNFTESKDIGEMRNDSDIGIDLKYEFFNRYSKDVDDNISA